MGIGAAILFKEFRSNVIDGTQNVAGRGELCGIGGGTGNTKVSEITVTLGIEQDVGVGAAHEVVKPLRESSDERSDDLAQVEPLAVLVRMGVQLIRSVEASMM